MKKLFVAVLAIAAAVACNTAEIVDLPQNPQINFANAFVQNATRATEALDPSTTTTSLNAFDVWGFMDSVDGAVFVGEDVTGSKGNFSYVNTQYWAPGHTYYFAAVAPMNSANVKVDTTSADLTGIGTIAFTNVEGTEDLLYSAVVEEAPALGEAKTVNFTFHHLLSKVKFTFTNGFTNDNAYITVENVKITNAPATATATLTGNWWEANPWAGHAGEVVLSFGNACEKLAMGKSEVCADERLTIPTTADYIVTFDVKLYMGDVLAYEGHKVATIEDATFELGKAYNLTATLDAKNVAEEALQPIVFDVEKVNEWVPAGDVNATVATPVATAEELIAAVEEGGNVVLTADINLGAGTRADYGLEIKANTVLDGNGYTITCSAVRAINVCASATEVTIKDLNLVAGGERGINAEGADKKLTIENVTAVSNNYTVNLVGSTVNNVVEINNCDLKGLNVVNVWGENSKVTVNNTTLRCEDNNASEGYGVVAVNNMAEGAEVVVNGGEVIISGTACEDTVAGILVANGGASLAFVGTAGNPVVEGQSYLIRYGDYIYTFATWEEAYEAAQAGETIVLTKNVALSNPLQVSKNIAVDLNGHTLTAPVFAESNGAVLEGDSDSYVFWVKEGATLTINGEGTVAAQNAKYSIAVWAQGGNVVINGGTYTNAGEGADLIYASAGGNVVINGGEFVACPKQAGVDGTLNAYSALNVKDADYRSGASNIVVYGGKFFQFNPADNVSEGANTNFCAEGKTVEQNGDWYIVK